MPSTGPERHANLARLCSELASHAQTLQRDFHPAAPASKLSIQLSLAHSRASKSFIRICRDRCLSSRVKLEAEGKLTPDTGCDENILGTNDDVFFYVAPFRYPHTTCGLLFAHSLEEQHTASAKATPFDSGGLIRHITRPDPSEPVCDFLSRHDMPAVDHRQYLGHSLTTLFNQPEDYLEGRPPQHPSPIGLTGGDERAWTHEVRLTHRVPLLGNPHLKAIFLANAIANDPDVEAVLTWSQQEGIDINFLPGNRDGDFSTLQQACLRYLKRELYS
jgi:hypothetical protein